MIELVRRRREVYDIHIDRESLIENNGDDICTANDKLRKGEQEALDKAVRNNDDMVPLRTNFDTQIILVYNGKSGGGRIMLNPLGMINDGYFELGFVSDRFSASTAMQLFHYVK